MYSEPYPSWYDRLTPEDRRALRPLQYAHINPYGNFVLDMSTRLALHPTTENRA